MPNRFIFRQVYFGDLSTFLADGEIRAKNHTLGQICHQTSYQELVNLRGTDAFEMPNCRVVNDYVPFYFSPLTAFTYAIHCGNVSLKSPDGVDLGIANGDERIFFVCSVDAFCESGLSCCFSDFPLNSLAPQPTIKTDFSELETHVHWDVFDEKPVEARISEIGYEGVCKYFLNAASPPSRQLRSQKRMAEFLIADAVPLNMVTCIIVKAHKMRDGLNVIMNESTWNIPIYTNRGCYF